MASLALVAAAYILLGI